MISYPLHHYIIYTCNSLDSNVENLCVKPTQKRRNLPNKLPYHTAHTRVFCRLKMQQARPRTRRLENISRGVSLSSQTREKFCYFAPDIFNSPKIVLMNICSN